MSPAAGGDGAGPAAGLLRGQILTCGGDGGTIAIQGGGLFTSHSSFKLEHKSPAGTPLSAMGIQNSNRRVKINFGFAFEHMTYFRYGTYRGFI